MGAGVTDAMGRQAPAGLLGIHTNLLVTALADVTSLPADGEEERAALDAIASRQDRMIVRIAASCDAASSSSARERRARSRSTASAVASSMSTLVVGPT